MASPMDAQEAVLPLEEVTQFQAENANADSRYSYDEESLQRLKDEKPWMKNVKHFVLDECDKMLEQLGNFNFFHINFFLNLF